MGIQTNELIKGTLTTIILTLLQEHGRMYGYEITKAVKDRSDGKILLKEGSLYPALHRLQADGLLASEEEMIGKRARIYYKLTAAGKKRTTAQVDELVSFFETIQELIFNPKPLPNA
jgi:PadR family transcriptional regulator, regulatory protein PadR